MVVRIAKFSATPQMGDFCSNTIDGVEDFVQQRLHPAVSVKIHVF